MLNLVRPPAPPPPKPKPRFRMWVKSWILETDDKGTYNTLMADPYNTDIPRFRNYIKMTPEFLNAYGEAGPKAHQEKDQLE